MSQSVWQRETQLSPGPGGAHQAQEFVGLELWQHHHEDLVGDVQVVAGHLVADFPARAGGTIVVALEEHPFCLILTVRSTASVPVVLAPQGADEPDARPVLTSVMTSVGWGSETDAHGGWSVWVMFALQPPTFREWVAGV